MTIREIWDEAVRARAHHPFLVCEDPDTGVVETITYAQMDCRVNRRVALLQQRGLCLGTKVAVQLGNEAAFVEFFLALAKCGGVLVPIGCDCTCYEVAKIFEVVHPDILVCHADTLDENGQWKVGEFSGEIIVVEEIESFDQMRECDSFHRDVCRDVTEEAIGECPRAEQMGGLSGLPELNGDSLFEIMLTSGTTGVPKGVMLTHANAVFSGRYVNWELEMTRDDTYLTSMMATHVNLQFSALLPVITAQATLVLEKRYSARHFWDSVRSRGATLVQAMAMIVRTMLVQPEVSGEKDHCVRYVHYFLPITENERAEFLRRFGAPLLNNYGSTECLIGAVTDYPGQEGRWPSIGKAGPGYEVRIATVEGAEAEIGRSGEIQLRGKPGVSLMAGYYGRPDLTREVLDSDGWYSTGDCGYMDKDGWVFFLDRYSDLIKRAGENISAREVEEALLCHPGVADVAVVAAPDPIRDEAVKAVVVRKSGCEVTEESLVNVAKESLADFKIPTIIEFREELPRGKYGKVRKNLLKAS